MEGTGYSLDLMDLAKGNTLGTHQQTRHHKVHEHVFVISKLKIWAKNTQMAKEWLEVEFFSMY